VPHVDLSLAELGLTSLPPSLDAMISAADVRPASQAQPPAADEPLPPDEPLPSDEPLPPADPMKRWADAVVDAVEPCVVIDAAGQVVAMSPSCQRMFGLAEPPVGQPLHGGVLHLVDFSDERGALTDNEVGKIPPLLSLRSGRLARGLIRATCADTACTLDAIATPIGEQGAVIGSLTFFSRV
jgi:PAS domain-containing protein